MLPLNYIISLTGIFPPRPFSLNQTAEKGGAISTDTTEVQGNVPILINGVTTIALPDMHWHLREAQPADAEFLQTLFDATHADEFAPLALPADQLRALLRMQATAQRTGYARDFPAARAEIVCLPNVTPIGRLLVDETADRIRPVDVALLPAWRGQGIGGAVVGALIAESDRLGKIFAGPPEPIYASRHLCASGRW